MAIVFIERLVPREAMPQGVALFNLVDIQDLSWDAAGMRNGDLRAGGSLIACHDLLRAMKHIALVPFATLVTCFSSCREGAESKEPGLAPNEAASVTGEVRNQETPNQKAFRNLPEESRNEFIACLAEAKRLFDGGKIPGVLAELDKAEAIFQDSAELHNLRGSCHLYLRDFDRALADFRKAASFSKNNPNIEFNIAEVLFVTKQWHEALDQFAEVAVLLPPENIALGSLVDFKILLCTSALGKIDECKILAMNYGPDDQSPFFCFSRAAIAFAEEDPQTAEAWLAAANRKFPEEGALAPWLDALVEFGSIRR